MSRNRIKAVGYEDDDYYDDEDEHYEEEEVSAEDREKMRVGVIEVRQLLELQLPPVPATEQEISEALWNYYYDVDTSVEYLKSMFAITPRPTETGIWLTLMWCPEEKYFPPAPKKKKKGKMRYFLCDCFEEGGDWGNQNGLSALRQGPTFPCPNGASSWVHISSFPCANLMPPATDARQEGSRRTSLVNI
jgi:hypothetical protein